jgi:lipopolysaccharide transport system ATP-binding protein
MTSPEFAIKVEHLSKKYRIGAAQLPYQTLRDRLANGARGVLQSFRRRSSLPAERADEIWALRDVSFEVKPGEVVGVIGRNGAGKSTLLKLLTHITSPSQGRIEIHGRVGSLLEVGTGFSNELTGRENIYLNGAILGMKKAEIERKFDEIAAFAEVEKFLDTPVKHYSTGMYMRLAFAVAAHLEPEILLVDEVLAVGDAEFQKKCLGKMGEVAEEGRTVLFVSHSMAAIQTLCGRSILINKSQIDIDGLTPLVISRYLEGKSKNQQRQPDHLIRDLPPKGMCKVSYFRIDSIPKRDIFTIQSGMDIEFVFGCIGEINNEDMLLSWVLRDSTGQQLILNHNKLEGTQLRTYQGLFEVVCSIKNFPLTAGKYSIHIEIVVIGNYVDNVNTEEFTVEEGDFFGNGMTIESRNARFLFRGIWTQRIFNI